MNFGATWLKIKNIKSISRKREYISYIKIQAILLKLNATSISYI